MKTYYVMYNAKLMAYYKSLKCAMNFISRKGWKNDEYNMLDLFDEEGNYYSPVNGESIEIE